MGYLGTKPQIATSLANNIVTADAIVSGAVTDAKIAAMAASKLTGQVPDANAPSGSVIQVVSTNKSNVFSTTSTSFTDVTGLSVAITPSNTSNTVLVTLTMCVSCTDGNRGTFQLVRNGTVIANTAGTSGGFYSCAFAGYISTGFISSAFTFLDSPSTASSVTYKIQAMTNAGTVFVNQNRGSDTGTGYIGFSTITLTEIAA